MQVIIGIPPHIIVQGMPMTIIPFIIAQQAFIISICAMSAGIILQIIPSLVISQVIVQDIMARIPPIIIPIMPGIIMGAGIPIIDGIIGGMFMDIIGIMGISFMAAVIDLSRSRARPFARWSGA